jgi:hypothetical protein
VTYGLRDRCRRSLALPERSQLDKRPARVRQHRRDRVPAVVLERDQVVGHSRADDREGDGDNGSNASEHGD